MTQSALRSRKLIAPWKNEGPTDDRHPDRGGQIAECFGRPHQMTACYGLRGLFVLLKRSVSLCSDCTHSAGCGGRDSRLNSSFAPKLSQTSKGKRTFMNRGETARFS